MEILFSSAVTLTLLALTVLILWKIGKLEAIWSRLREIPLFIRNNVRPLLWSLGCLLFVGLFLYYFYIPPAMRIRPVQPIPFSHRVHVGHKRIQCEFCHPYVKRSTFPGLPPVEKCLYCHKYIIARHPQILKEHDYFNTKTPTPWAKVNYVPEYVFFNHQRHIKKEIACQQCHGPVEETDRLPSKHWRMQTCIECHRAKKANLGCWLACHN